MSRIDRYLDDVLAGMNLSGAQLAAVEREIRSHIERIVAAEMKRYGLSREEAETDALASLGYPFPPVRRSGLAEGYGWFLFEWITLVAAFLFFLVFTIATDWKQTWYFVLMAVVFGVQMFQSSWERVDVHGGLVVRRLFGRSHRIPFEALRRIRLQRGQIFRKKNIVVEYAGGKAILSASMRGMRVASLVLQALYPATMDRDVSELLEHMRKPPRRETRTFRLGFTAAWVLVAIGFDLGAEALWTFRGASPFLLASVALAPMVLFFQRWRHVDRARTSVCWLLLVLYFFSLTGAYFFLAGPIDAVRMCMIGFAVVVIGSLVALWWRGSGHGLLVTTLVLVAIGFVISTLTEPSWRDRLIPMAEVGGIPVGAQWSGPEGKTFTVVLNTGYDEDSEGYLLQADDKGHEVYRLGPGDWSPAFDPTTTTLTLVSRPISEGLTPGGRVFTYAPGQSIQEIEPLPSQLYALGTALALGPLWSPDRRYLYTPVYAVDPEPSDPAALQAVTSVQTGVCRIFGPGKLHDWLDDTRLRVLVESKTTDTVNFFSLPRVYHEWEWDVTTGERRDVAEHTLKPGFSFHYRPSGSATLATNDQTGEIGFYNLNTREFVRLPGTGPGAPFLGWDAAYKTVVYVSIQESQRQLVKADPTGVLDRVDLQGQPIIEQITPSPDGNRVLFLAADGQGVVGKGLYAWKLLDWRTKEFTTVSALGALEGFTARLDWLAPFYVGGRFWTPDSRSVALGVRNFAVSTKKGRYFQWEKMRFYRVDCEELR